MSQLVTLKGLLATAFLCAILTLVLGQRPLDDSSKFRASERPIAGSYIVVLKSLVHREGVEPLASDLVRQNGGTKGFIYRHALKGFSARMSKAAAMALSRDPRVEYVEEDGMGSVLTTQENPPYGLDRIDQRDLPLSKTYTYGNDGAGVHVYVLDTGIRITHDEFRNPNGTSRASVAFDSVDDDGVPGNDSNDAGGKDGLSICINRATSTIQDPGLSSRNTRSEYYRRKHFWCC